LVVCLLMWVVVRAQLTNCCPSGECPESETEIYTCFDCECVVVPT